MMRFTKPTGTENSNTKHFMEAFVPPFSLSTPDAQAASFVMRKTVTLHSHY
jgi:hypothetical protein